MPNVSLAANAASMPSRRLFLAAGPAVAVFTALRGARAVTSASSPADGPLFELVAEGKRWWKEVCDICDLPEDSPGYEQRLGEAHSRYSDAFDEAVRTVPQSVAGVRALLGWVKEDCEDMSLPDEDVAALVDSLLASPALAMEA